jgi:fructokinase
MNGSERPGPVITVIGEALIDLLGGQQPRTFTALPGGSPYNVAIGLARLGQRVALMARLSRDAFGGILREQALAESIELAAAPNAAEPTTLAVVSLDADAGASYYFHRQGTADWQWTAEEIGRAPAQTAVLHFGSIASWTPPGDGQILALARRMCSRGDVLVSYDPNIRPDLLTDRHHGQQRVERAMQCAHVAKASTEDIAWLYPGATAEEVARRWLDLGPGVVVITASAGGAHAFTAQGRSVHRPARQIKVVDTIGAGDSFTAGLIGSLMERGLRSPALLAACPESELAAIVDDAILVASLNCQRQGNDPPTAADLESARLADRVDEPW